MPESLRDNNLVARAYVQEHDIETVLDVGAGSGTYAKVLHGLVFDIDAVEVWRPYVKQFGLTDLYRDIVIGNVTDLAYAGWTPEQGVYDLVIFGDVLEHMTADDARTVWAWAKTVAKRGLISVPIVDWLQGHVHGNPFEKHVQDLVTVAEWQQALGPFDVTHVYDQTATFLKEF